MSRSEGSGWTPPWVAACVVVGTVALVLAIEKRVLPLEWWVLPPIGVVGAVVTALATLAQGGWLRTHAHRAGCWLAAGAWSGWAAATEWVPWAASRRAGWTWLALILATMLLVGLAKVCATPEPPPNAAPDQPGFDRRPTEVRRWEAWLREIVKKPATVTGIDPWANPRDGFRLSIDLPVGMTSAELAGFTDALGSAAKLPQGCAVRVLDGEHQGTAVLDVMRRDCLADEVLADESTAPASIYDEFTVMTAPSGETLTVCLRSQSMVVGGAPDSGKTTLLHRIIMWLARCTDALVWIADTNGGGVAEPWISPWARGECERPAVDWVADTEDEAAVMIAVASAIVKDRKTSREATKRKRAANTTVLPVDRDLPAIVVLNDEGGEMRQAASLLGQLADQGISRLAQIGRAEGGRVIKSVLRGTADLLDKGMRVNAALRICLQMLEHDEYGHVLGANPGKTKLLHKGSGYLSRPSDPKPIFGRTVNVLLDMIERHAIACAPLRPDLDDRGRLVASRVTVADVLDGRDPKDRPEALLPVMRDVAAGRAYEGRWVRYAPKLAEMRGEDVPDVDPDVAHPGSVAPGPTAVPPKESSALAAWAAQVDASVKPRRAEPVPPDPVEPEPTSSSVPAAGADDQAWVDGEFERLVAGMSTAPAAAKSAPVATETDAPSTARARIVSAVDAAGPAGMSAGDIEDVAGVARSRVTELIRQLREAGELVYRDAAPGADGKRFYVTPRHAR